MKLSIKNLGKIETADIEINAITVITGENNTGKSTISKTLFCLLNSLYKIDERIKAERKKGVDASVSDGEVIATMLKHRLKNAFNGQINNVRQPNTESEIVLTVNGESADIRIKSNDQLTLLKRISLNTDAIYMDDASVLDPLSQTPLNQYHHKYLRHLLQSNDHDFSVKSAMEEIINRKKLERVVQLIDSVFTGNLIVKDDRAFLFSEQNSDAEINISNISTGLKIFVIIKILILNGWLDENSTLILDEPEIHLHPKWQLKLVEIIVLLQKELNLRVLLNTHSPYFLEAVEVYTEKHGIADKCKYYLSVNTNESVYFEDITDDTEKTYKKLAEPFQILDDERYPDD